MTGGPFVTDDESRPIIHDKPIHTSEQLVALRRRSVLYIGGLDRRNQLGLDYSDPLPPETERERALRMLAAVPIEFTCDDCALAPRCDFAFDPYNTNGDCLAEK